ncbi:MAG: tRNA epoxyqueuosine(34) reductase QueG [Elusimicrobia bacterium]|nr:tRNA epoxyqueuosine(34) reductase QueG [Elusimicrobiota bacterium]
MASVTKADVLQAAHEVGIDLVGFAGAAPLAEDRGRMEEALSGGRVPLEGERRTRDLAAFCDPSSVLQGAASVVCAAQSYLKDEPDDLSKPGEPHGLIAAYTRRNHYKDLKDRLKALAGLLGLAPAKCSSCGPLAEKPLARRSGLGWYGKHGIIITKPLGSWVVLGELVTGVEFEPDPEVPDSCGDCRACVQACPTGAITGPGRLDRSKCFQHLTNSSSAMPLAWRDLWAKRLYGCVTCQQVCPKNQGLKPLSRSVEKGVVGPSIPVSPLLSMSEAEYRERFKGNQVAARWVRFESIRRNACLALGNSGDPAAAQALEQALAHDPAALVRGHAAWSLGKLSGPAAKPALERARASEPDREARSELESALARLR